VWDTRATEAPVGSVNGKFTFHLPKAYQDGAVAALPALSRRSMARALARAKGGAHQDVVITNPGQVAMAQQHPKMRALVTQVGAVVRDHQTAAIEQGHARGLIPASTRHDTVVRAYKHAALRAMHKAGLGDYDTHMDEAAKAEFKPLVPFMRYAARRVFDHLNQGGLKGSWQPFRDEFGTLYRQKKFGKLTGHERMRMRTHEQFIKLNLGNLSDEEMTKAFNLANLHGKKTPPPNHPQPGAIPPNQSEPGAGGPNVHPRPPATPATGARGPLPAPRVPPVAPLKGKPGRPRNFGEKSRNFGEKSQGSAAVHLTNTPPIAGAAVAQPGNSQDTSGQVPTAPIQPQAQALGRRYSSYSLMSGFGTAPQASAGAGGESSAPSNPLELAALAIAAGRAGKAIPMPPGGLPPISGASSMTDQAASVESHFGVPTIGGSTVYDDVTGLYRIQPVGDLEKMDYGFRLGSDFTTDPKRQLQRAIHPRMRRNALRLRLNTQRDLHRQLNGGVTRQERWQFGPMGKQAVANNERQQNPKFPAIRQQRGAKREQISVERQQIGVERQPLGKRLVTESDVRAAARRTQSPSPAQAKAGNYRMGHLFVGGLDISIETPKGAMRRGVGPSGKAWSVRMPAHYGYIKKTVGADGDHLDVYLGPDAHHADQHPVFVIDQHKTHGAKAFDEHKSFLGFVTRGQAVTTYDQAFSDGRGPDRRNAVHTMTFSTFKHWADNCDTSGPLAKAYEESKHKRDQGGRWSAGKIGAVTGGAIAGGSLGIRYGGDAYSAATGAAPKGLLGVHPTVRRMRQAAALGGWRQGVVHAHVQGAYGEGSSKQRFAAGMVGSHDNIRHINEAGAERTGFGGEKRPRHDPFGLHEALKGLFGTPALKPPPKHLWRGMHGKGAEAFLNAKEGDHITMNAPNSWTRDSSIGSHFTHFDYASKTGTPKEVAETEKGPASRAGSRLTAAVGGANTKAGEKKVRVHLRGLNNKTHMWDVEGANPLQGPQAEVALGAGSKIRVDKIRHTREGHRIVFASLVEQDEKAALRRGVGRRLLSPSFHAGRLAGRLPGALIYGGLAAAGAWAFRGKEKKPLTKAFIPLGGAYGHGHVTPHPHGIKARCGGPGLCSSCKKEWRDKYGADFPSKGELGKSFASMGASLGRRFASSSTKLKIGMGVGAGAGAALVAPKVKEELANHPMARAIAGGAIAGGAAALLTHGRAVRGVRGATQSLYRHGLHEALREHVRVLDGGSPSPLMQTAARKAMTAGKKAALQHAQLARKTGMAGIRPASRTIAGAAAGGAAIAASSGTRYTAPPLYQAAGDQPSDSSVPQQ
jgi:hypothetical protein